jgi:hypothetical protein
MSSNPVPVRIPERQPEVAAVPKPAWPREKKTSKFVVKIAGVIPG